MWRNISRRGVQKYELVLLLRKIPVCPLQEIFSQPYSHTERSRQLSETEQQEPEMLQKAWELPSEKVLTGLWACIKHQIKYQGAGLDELRAFCVCRAQSYFFICIYIHIHILPLASELTFKQQQIKSGCMTSLPLLLLNVDSCITAGDCKHSRAHTATGSWTEGLLTTWGPVSLLGAATRVLQTSFLKRVTSKQVKNRSCVQQDLCKGANNQVWVFLEWEGEKQVN